MSIMDTLLKFEPPPRTNLRERLIRNQLDRLASHGEQARIALQDIASRGLSPVEQRLNAQYLENLEGAKSRLSEQLDTVRKQDALYDYEEEQRADLDPLDRVRTRKGYFRGKSAEEAMLGILQRERRMSAPLTREAWSRAKAIAASRLYYDPAQSQLRGARGSAYSPSASDIAPNPVYDPCDEIRAARRTRREVMFASGSAGRGVSGHRGVRGPRRNIC